MYRNTVDFGTVDQDGLTAAFTAFVKLAVRGEKEITLRIDSFGGSIYMGRAWERAVEDIKKQRGITVTCIVDGSAYSMTAVILEGPVCDSRMMTSRSTVLFHNGSSGAKGTVEDLQQTAAHLEALNVAMGLQVSKRLGLTLADYRAKIAGKDWAMAAPEALTSNVVDGLALSYDIAPPEDL